MRHAALIGVLALSMTAAAAAGQYGPGHPYAAPHGPRGNGSYRPAPPPRTTPPARQGLEGRPPATQFPGRRFIPALSSVNLNAEQRDRIRSLVESTRQANQNADPETRRQNIAKMRNGIWQTLTPEQQTQFRNELNRPSDPADGP